LNKQVKYVGKVLCIVTLMCAIVWFSLNKEFLNESRNAEPSKTLPLESVDYSKRTLEHFNQITQDMSNAELRDLVGIPDDEVGSGIYIFTYTLNDKSQVIVGTVGDNVHYVRHNGIDILHRDNETVSNSD